MGVVGPAESYLKASDAPDLQKPDKALQSPPPASTDPATMLSGNAGEGATACGGSAAAGQDLISVPRNTFMTLLQTNLDNKPPRQTPLPYAAPLPPFSHQAIATAPSYGPGAGAVSPAGGYFTSPGGYYAGPAGGDPGAFLATCPAFVGPGRRWPLNTTRLGYWPHPCPASESPRGFSEIQHRLP